MPKLRASSSLKASEDSSTTVRTDVLPSLRTDTHVRSHVRLPVRLPARVLSFSATSLLLAALVVGSLAGCSKNKKQIGGGRGAIPISNSESVLDPRFSVFLSKAYFAVASRREATSRIKLIKKGRLAERGVSVEPEEIKRGRKLQVSDLSWLREQRQKLISLLSTVAGRNTSMFATAALAQANFDCWYFEMYKRPLISRNSSCGLDLAAALGSASGRGLAQAGIFQSRANVPRVVGDGQQGFALGGNQQGFATGQQFSSLQRYLEKSDIDTLLMFLREGEEDMRVVVEKLVEQQLAKTNEGASLPLWQITFKGKKRKLSKSANKTIKTIARWYKEQAEGLILRVDGSRLDSERVERVIKALVKKGVRESIIVRGEADSSGASSAAGEVSISAQRSR